MSGSSGTIPSILSASCCPAARSPDWPSASQRWGWNFCRRASLHRYCASAQSQQSVTSYMPNARRRRSSILSFSACRLFAPVFLADFLFRLGIGALPFLLPLLLQVGFHLTPFQSGLITFTAALGAMFMKAVVASVLHRFGYRNVLIYNALISSAFLAACATFVQGMPFAAMVAILLSGGFFRSLQFTSINTIA